MRIVQLLRPEYIQLGLRHGHIDEIDPLKSREQELSRLKNEVISELAELFGKNPAIRNCTKFRKDLAERESRGSTAIGDGIALPHIRSMQPNKAVFVFARSIDGVWYDAPDGKLVHVFFGVAAPVYDNNSTASFYQFITRSFKEETWLLPALLEADTEHEIIRILSQLQ